MSDGFVKISDVPLWPAMTVGQRCGDCVHWYENPERKGLGQCRQAPPSVVVFTNDGVKPVMNAQTGEVRNVPVKQHTIKPHFPPLDASDPGCGQFKAKPNDAC